MSTLSHTCCICGHKWESLGYTNERGKKVPASKVAKDIRTAVSVNKQGPYCLVCHHLIMACRAAKLQGVGIIGALERAITHVAQEECAAKYGWGKEKKRGE